jgi:hypothetical protein
MNTFMSPACFTFVRRHGIKILTVAVAFFAAWIALRYAYQPLLEAHPFRQTQTALTAFWMVKEGWQLAYQTPVGGYPWSIPFEFPIFQLLASLISQLGGWDLDPVGRLLSFSFLLACAWPAFSIAHRLELTPDVAWIFCALLWSSPLYMFWGRTFMIETTALFFIFAAIPYALDLREEQPSWRSALLFTVLATLGMLQKVTTAVSIIIVMGLVVLHTHVAAFGVRLPTVRKSLLVLVAFAIPILLGLAWTYFTDIVKAQNQMGIHLTSKGLADWNFGSLEQRLNFGKMKTLLWERSISDNAAGLLGVFLLGWAAFSGEPRIRKLVLVCLCLFALPMLIFTNLHLIHFYYPASAVVFLLGALAIASTQWMQGWMEWRKVFSVAVFCFTLANLANMTVVNYLFIDPLIENSGPGLVAFFCLVGLALLFGENNYRRLVLVTLAGVFTLVLIASSVQVAINRTYSAVFLAGALVVATALLVLGLATSRPLGRFLVVCLLVFLNLFHFSMGYVNKLWSIEDVKLPAGFHIAKEISRITPQDSAIVIFGLDWSSVIGYYAQRKSFAVPDWFLRYDDAWQNPSQFLGGKKLSAIVFCESEKVTSVDQILEQPDVKRHPKLSKFGGCYLWVAE